LLEYYSFLIVILFYTVLHVIYLRKIPVFHVGNRILSGFVHSLLEKVKKRKKEARRKRT